jgi:hypothetical protein
MDMELKEKQMEGIIRMRGWFEDINKCTESIVWTHSVGGLWGVSTKAIVQYLDNIIIKGSWRERDREVLNGMRDFYNLNKEKYIRDLVTTLN